MYNGNLPATSNREAWAGMIRYVPSTTADIPMPSAIVMSVKSDRFCRTFSMETGEIELATDGTFTWLVEDTVMRQACPGPLRVGIVMTFEDLPQQLFIGTVDVEAGVTP